jgi:hypothetical protein
MIRNTGRNLQKRLPLLREVLHGGLRYLDTQLTTPILHVSVSAKRFDTHYREGSYVVYRETPVKFCRGREVVARDFW